MANKVDAITVRQLHIHDQQFRLRLLNRKHGVIEVMTDINLIAIKVTLVGECGGFRILNNQDMVGEHQLILVRTGFRQ